MTIRVLCTADVHIGRSSSCDGDVGGEVSALAALRRIVDVAVQQQPTAVVIAGDLYDGLAAQYATRPAVKRAFETLRNRDIPVLAVAGNHDHSALPAFAQAHPGLFHLFGSASWSEQLVGPLRFVGRSFGSESESKSLLGSFDLPGADVPTVGLIHADIDNAGSSYGPTPIGDFAGRGVSAWVVGHIHVPRLYAASQPVAYPGSPQALDWGETGVHGFRWLTIEHGQASFSDVIPLSSVRYECITIELSPGDSVEAALMARSADYRRDHDALGSIQFRVNIRVVGGGDCPPLPQEPTTLDRDCYSVWSKIIVPQVDLAAEATHADARGQAARLLLGLKGEGDPVWRQHALGLVESVGRSIAEERRKLNLPPGEDLDSLRHGAPDDAHVSVRRALENVMVTSREAQ